MIEFLLLVAAVVLFGFAIEVKMIPERPGRWGSSMLYAFLMTLALCSYSYFLRRWL